MNVDDLDWQASNYGGIAPGSVRLLLEHGHLGLIIQTAAERGEWFCAEGAAEELCRAGEFGRALEVVEPFVASGWRAALWAKADVVLQAGRTQEALDLVRPDEAGGTAKVHRFARLLTRAGRIDQAIALLVPHLDGGWARFLLVEITEGQGRDEQVLELIAPHAESARQARGEGRWNSDLSNAQELQAQVMERAGRADEAIRTLGEDIAERRFLTQNTLIAYAELLARHGRLDELRELAVQNAHELLDVYADALRTGGRAKEAETVMCEAIAADDWVGYRAWLSSALLQDGRLDDAVAVAEPGFSWYDCSNLLAPLVHQLHDRPEELLRLLEHPLTVPHHGHEEFQHNWRAWALAELGRIDEAIAVAEADPAPWKDPRIVKAGLLATAGHLDAAATELRALGTIEARQELFDVLVRQGRAAEAVAVHPTVAEQRAAKPKPVPLDENGYSSEPPF
ncbi:hypothetical protein [Streptomyces fradiae]|uniref:hypothetical protein n=1 Tax=Streptomyces fradiae TaxID=1906 RepID=UPI003513BABE